MKQVSAEEKPRILVADDGRRNLQMMEALLITAGYDVTTASDGEETLHKIHEHPPDLVLLDVMMPRLDGYQVCARLKGDDKTRLIPVILIAPAEELEDKIRGIEAGSDAFLYRPVTWIELLARVESLLRAKRLNDELVSLENTIIALANAVEAKDPHAEGHIERVAAYASILSSEVRLPRREQQLMRRGAILHDVGKIGVGDSVLLKRGRLTDEEFEQIKIHPLVGEKICQPLQSRLILDVIRHHHERYDGKGYPDGLSGEDIPIAARIMAIVDTYDALTSDRPYRRRLSQKEALEVLRKEAGKQFDPELVLTFIELVESRRLTHLP